MTCNLLELPEWLPPFFSYSQWNDYLWQVFSIFKEDWEQKPTASFLNKPVIYDVRKTKEDLPEGFWHIVSQKSPNTQNRIPDITRAERILWVKAIIIAANNGVAEVATFIETKKNARGRQIERHHVFLNIPSYSHLVILEESTSEFVLVTSFDINEGSKKCHDYRKKLSIKQTGAPT